MPRWAHNKLPSSVRQRYFELIRSGLKGSEAARRVGVSTSCGSLWFIDAGSMTIPDPSPISPRFLTQDDRIAIADGLATKVPVKEIAAGIGKSFQTVYREIARGSKPDGRYQPWWAHNQALLRRRRPKRKRILVGTPLWQAITDKLHCKWSPPQISRFLKRAFPHDPSMRACAETIYQALFAGVLGPIAGKLRTGRQRRKPHRRGVPTKNKIANMRLLDQRPAEVAERRTIGHWEGDLIIGANMRSAIGTLVERVSRYVVLVHLPDGYTAPVMRDALTARLLELPPHPAPDAHLGPGPRAHPARTDRSGLRHHASSSASHDRPGSDRPTRTPTACSVSTSRSAPTSPCTAEPTSTTSPPNSTIGPASSSATAHHTTS